MKFAVIDLYIATSVAEESDCMSEKTKNNELYLSSDDKCISLYYLEIESKERGNYYVERAC